MGLDNGIVVRNAKNKYKGIKDFWDGIDARNDISKVSPILKVDCNGLLGLDRSLLLIFNTEFTE